MDGRSHWGERLVVMLICFMGMVFHVEDGNLMRCQRETGRGGEPGGMGGGVLQQQMFN